MRLGNRKFGVSGIFATVGTLALLLSACGGSSSGTNTGAQKASDQTLKIAYPTGGGADIPTMDPGISYDSASEPIVTLVFDPLVTLDKNLKVIPWAAKSWTTQDNGATYVFTLQSGQTFSDGTPVKASDYAQSMDRQFSPCAGGAFTSAGTSALMLDQVNASGVKDSNAYGAEKCAAGKAQGAITSLVGDSIIADDTANTLTIKLSNPAGYFVDSLSLPFSMALEGKLVNTRADLGADGTWLDELAQGATGQGGSGMFYVASWDHKTHLTLKPNPHWWGIAQGMKPNFSEVDFNLFDSLDTAYSTYLTDKTYAMVDGLPSAQLAAAKQDGRPVAQGGKGDYQETPAASVETVGMNWNQAPFNDINARKAFCLALNRNAINTSVFKGGQTPSWNLYPPSLPGGNSAIKGIDGAGTSGDLAKAQSYWTAYKATLNGKPVPPITLNFNIASSTSKLLAEAYQSTWKTAFPDANITISTEPWKQQIQALYHHNMQLGRDGWLADYPDPQDFLSILYSTGLTNNFFNVSLPAVDSQLKQADGITDPSQQSSRYSMYNQAEQTLVDNVAVCPVTTGVFHYRQQPWVQGNWAWAPNEQVPLPAWASGFIATH